VNKVYVNMTLADYNATVATSSECSVGEIVDAIDPVAGTWYTGKVVEPGRVMIVADTESVSGEV